MSDAAATPAERERDRYRAALTLIATTEPPNPKPLSPWAIATCALAAADRDPRQENGAISACTCRVPTLDMDCPDHRAEAAALVVVVRTSTSEATRS